MEVIIMSSEKRIRVLWDIYESVLLLEATLSVYKEGKDAKKIVRELSASLRTKAIQQNLVIDDYYRNINGINLKMQEMLYLLSKGDRGIAKASKFLKKPFDCLRRSRKYIRNY